VKSPPTVTHSLVVHRDLYPDQALNLPTTMEEALAIDARGEINDPDIPEDQSIEQKSTAKCLKECFNSPMTRMKTNSNYRHMVSHRPSKKRLLMVERIFLGYRTNTLKNVVWYDLLTDRVKYGYHVRFDEGFSDLPLLKLPPNVALMDRCEE